MCCEWVCEAAEMAGDLGECECVVECVADRAEECSVRVVDVSDVACVEVVLCPLVVAIE